MERKRNEKMIAILALCVAVVGLTLGFAAFSNTLTISSSAAVTPDKKDFKLTIYGLTKKYDKTNDMNVDSVEAADISLYTSTTSAGPLINSNTDGEFATIDNSTLSLKNLKATFNQKGSYVDYLVVLKNEGKYDAYIDVASFTQPAHTCEPGEGTTATLVAEACKGMSYSIGVGYLGEDGYIDWNVNNYFDENGNLTIPMNSHIYLDISLGYEYDSALADGEFTVTWDDVKVNFSTVSK